MKILIVEDEPALNEVLSDEFSQHGFEIASAFDGEEAMRKLRGEKIDLVLLDLILPKKDGIKVLEEVRGDRDLRDVPVIILSNLGQDEDIKRVLRLGADDYYVKSQHPIKEVVEKVKEILLKPPVRRGIA